VLARGATCAALVAAVAAGADEGAARAAARAFGVGSGGVAEVGATAWADLAAEVAGDVEGAVDLDRVGEEREGTSAVGGEGGAGSEIDRARDESAELVGVEGGAGDVGRVGDARDCVEGDVRGDVDAIAHAGGAGFDVEAEWLGGPRVGVVVAESTPTAARY
jgi:hypothetical protein